MGLVIRLIELLIVVVPIVGGLIAALRAYGRRRGAPPEQLVESAPDDVRGTPNSAAVLWQTITRVVDEHAQTNSRWLDYELDPVRLLDFPLMTDMREPLTMRFHQAKRRADLLRPVRAEDLLDDRESAAQYLAAVEEYSTAFDAAETEAIRRRRSDFSSDEQQRLGRGQSLLRVAFDDAATPDERQRAYELAHRELDGLIVLPKATRAAIERGIAGELEK
ncbi:hypothetical protein [Mycobacterium deserti]|uniref:Uncharacterized protein n=1 Tax=Mycobacterium deserti TaxID=2978347 RepID=A0ABT2MFR7_9MYCO|nr:hypothetical protein [Mycobacterium deserti]MCT7661131.1 hypothetical protein [Mycobacterium deserti]